MIENIDKRKKMEEALRKSEERFRIAAKTTSDLIRELNIETGQLEWFGEIDGKLGYKKGEFPRTQEAWENIIHHEDYPRIINEFDKHLKERQPYNTEYRVRKKDGSFLYLSDSGTILLDGEGKPNKMIGVCSDITDHKYTEQEQAKILQQLKKANEELSSFGYIVSHDLKAPLRGVKVLTDWIYKDYIDKIDEEGKQKMDLLVSRVDRMHNLIDGILQYSKIGRLEEEKNQVNLGELMPEIIDMVSPPENIEIIIENELPTIECGRIRIAQVFQNLLSNAVKYMDKPQGLIKINCVEDNNFWKFSVKDNGPGIAEEYFEKIFQMYQTLTPRDNYESTGVGLTVVKKIVKLYGGKIWVESQVGQGSTFIFTIPKLQEQKERIKNEKLHTNSVS
jgi:PAS domain S-box-containing protein